INGAGRTRIQLSRTTNTASTSPPPAEKGARLTIVDDAGGRYNLTEIASGSYRSDSLQLNPARQYQLRITTSANVTYESALVPLKITPPIDQLKWRLNANQVQLLLSTHDARQQSRYYRWGFVETWEFTSAYQSSLEYDRRLQALKPRTTPIYTCWHTERPSVIKQASTAQLSQDALLDASLLDLSANSERFKIRYSVLVNQYVETPEEFAYYELLRRNTEAVGGVNDPLPSQLTGNVRRVDNATEPVLGFVGAHTVQSTRLFISNADLKLPAGWQFSTYYQNCTQGIELFFDPVTRAQTLRYPHTRTFKSTAYTPIDIEMNPANGDTLGYSGSTTACVDCRSNGVNTKPSFW
ncbi:MAG TPA: DUF4249 domain-containing protein, partial [Hymenobacter sp.]|uniref:DUF4249 domain-containing protein n=1 Tax=Hymenobacter sp. TaxID=1898978 RepID=UPI002D80D9C8